MTGPVGGLPAPVTIIVTGQPVAKGRGRVGLVNGRPMVFTPKNTRKWESDARRVAREAMDGRRLLACPLHITVRAVFPIPASWPAWKRAAAQAGTLLHTSKPDGDNVLKAAKDALKGVVYLDDSYVVVSTVAKIFGPKPMVAIGVVPVEGVASSTTKRPA